MHGIAPELNEIEISFPSLESLAEFSKNKSVLCILKYDSGRSGNGKVRVKLVLPGRRSYYTETRESECTLPHKKSFTVMPAHKLPGSYVWSGGGSVRSVYERHVNGHEFEYLQ